MPEKPYPEFPLTPHASGKWQKKIRGRIYYFGRLDDPDTALKEYLHARDYLQAGVPVPADVAGALTVARLCDEYYQAKLTAHLAGEITSRTLKDIDRTCRRLARLMGRTRALSTLQPSDFQAMKAKLAQTLGPVSIGNEIQRVRSAFKWAFDSDLIDKPVKFGPDFRRPGMKQIRLARQKKPARVFEPEEVGRLIISADRQLRAILLLGINGGLGPSDISQMVDRHLNLPAGWVDYPRPKTGIPRRFPLWPETAEALRFHLERKPPPRHCNPDLVFRTKYGHPWVRQKPDGAWIDSLNQQLIKLKKPAGIDRENSGFYALRHTFETVASQGGDQIATDLVMGHADHSMAAVYRHRVDDERLVRVVEQVRFWLWPHLSKTGR